MDFEPGPDGKRPTLLDEDILFCDTGTLFALNWLRTAHAVIEKSNLENGETFKVAIDESFNAFRDHVSTCKNCNEI